MLIRNQLDVTFVLSFISLLQVAQRVSGNHVPIYEAIHGHTTCQLVLTTFPQSSAPDDGHMVAQNMLSTY